MQITLSVIFMKNENIKGKLYRKIDEPVFGQPETCDELLHKYGTYNIQPTADNENSFPKISQGLPSSRKKKNYKGFDKEERES
jgi:hypothetical protein